MAQTQSTMLRLPSPVSDIFDRYEEDGTKLVEPGEIYLCQVSEVVEGKFLKLRRHRDNALAPGRRKNRPGNDDDAEAGRRKWDAIKASMIEMGYDYKQPIEFQIRRCNEQRKLHQGHHRVCIAKQLGIPVLSVVFKSMDE
jgi:glutamyl/glutaminyl-tRNA synthetase